MIVVTKITMAVSRPNLIGSSSFNNKWICTKLNKITVNKNLESPKHYQSVLAVMLVQCQEVVEVDKELIIQEQI